MTLIHEETILARNAPGLCVRDLYCSEFRDAMRALADIMDTETPATSTREFVEREARRRRR